MSFVDLKFLILVQIGIDIAIIVVFIFLILLEDRNDLFSRADFHFKNLTPGQFKIFRVDFSDWLLLQDKISNYVKKGNLVVKPSELL